MTDYSRNTLADRFHAWYEEDDSLADWPDRDFHESRADYIVRNDVAALLEKGDVTESGESKQRNLLQRVADLETVVEAVIRTKEAAQKAGRYPAPDRPMPENDSLGFPPR